MLKSVKKRITSYFKAGRVRVALASMMLEFVDTVLIQNKAWKEAAIFSSRRATEKMNT